MFVDTISYKETEALIQYANDQVQETGEVEIGNYASTESRPQGVHCRLWLG